MTQIVGTLKSSTGVAIGCTIRATLDQRVIDEATSPDTLYTPVSGTFTVTGGVINFTLPESQTSGVTYLFEYLDTVTLEPYPGLDRFRAIVPNVATVEWTDLQASGLATDVIDTSIAGVVRKLLVSPNFWQAAQDYIFPYRGEWSNLSFYERGDVVSFNGSTYHFTHNVSLAGEVPGTSPYWRLWAQKGDTGTGTAGNDAAYDPIAWDGQTDAPSRNAVRDIIEQLPRSSDAIYDQATWDGSLLVPTQNALRDIIQTLARVSDLSAYAPLNSPNLQGSPAVPDVTDFANSTNQAANTRFFNQQRNVANGFAGLDASARVALAQLALITDQKGAANGIATLGADVKIPPVQMNFSQSGDANNYRLNLPFGLVICTGTRVVTLNGSGVIDTAFNALYSYTAHYFTSAVNSSAVGQPTAIVGIESGTIDRTGASFSVRIRNGIANTGIRYDYLIIGK